jgi:transcriptional regulator with XRE-family HTH domain
MPIKRAGFAARRKAVGLSQDQLAERLKIDRSTVARWEAGESEPQPWKRRPLATVLDISLEHLDELLAEAQARSSAAATGWREYAVPSAMLDLALAGNNGNNGSDALGADTAPGRISRSALVPQSAAPSAGPALPAGGRDPAWTAAGADGGADAVADLREAGYDAYEDLMIRRTFMAGAAALAGLSAVDTPAALEAMRHGMNRSLAAERADADVGEWQHIIVDYGEAYPIAAPAELVRSLMVDQLGLQAALRRPGSAARQRDLLRTGALLSAFTAQSMSNLGQPLEAKRWWRTAKNAADRSGDPYSITWIRGRELCHAMDSRPRPAVLRLIEEADGTAVTAPPEAALELTANKAQTFALYGREQDALAAIHQVREQFDKSPTGYSGSMLAWGEERLYNTESFAYSRLGKTTEAERATRDGLSLYAANDERSLRHPAGLRLNLAFTLVRIGDLREGLNLAQTVIDGLPEELRGTKIADGRKLLALVPPARQHDANVQLYREWMNSVA